MARPRYQDRRSTGRDLAAPRRPRPRRPARRALRRRSSSSTIVVQPKYSPRQVPNRDALVHRGCPRRRRRPRRCYRRGAARVRGRRARPDVAPGGRVPARLHPGSLAEAVTVHVPYGAVRGLVRRGRALVLSLDRSVPMPFHRFALARFTNDPAETLAPHPPRAPRGQHARVGDPRPDRRARRRAPVRRSRGRSARPGVPRAPRGPRHRRRDARARRGWLAWGGPVSDRHREAFEEAMSARLGLLPARARSPQPVTARAAAASAPRPFRLRRSSVQPRPIHHARCHSRLPPPAASAADPRSADHRSHPGRGPRRSVGAPRRARGRRRARRRARPPRSCAATAPRPRPVAVGPRRHRSRPRARRPHRSPRSPRSPLRLPKSAASASAPIRPCGRAASRCSAS